MEETEERKRVAGAWDSMLRPVRLGHGFGQVLVGRHRLVMVLVIGHFRA